MFFFIENVQNFFTKPVCPYFPLDLEYYKWEPGKVGVDLNIIVPWKDITVQQLENGTMSCNVKPPTIKDDICEKISEKTLYKTSSTKDGYEKKFPFDETLLVGLKIAREKLKKKNCQIKLIMW